MKPPGGEPPPAISAPLRNGAALDLVALAGEICLRYRGEFPDEIKRYGEVGNAWCRHDNQHLLNWAVEAVNGFVDMNSEVGWLASVLAARNFPIERLARSLDIGADVVRERVDVVAVEQLAKVLSEAATYVRSGVTTLGEAV
ncbi:MAG: hypothetical protein JWM76_398 [Pseudonocardiales bacterium]|nr:hypothetical protein [Pseudonocardiales bacterium]